MMGIQLRTPIANIRQYLQVEIDRREREIIRRLQYIGEQCVNEARTSGSYTDRTKNLRGSTGYVVVIDGEVQHASAFEQIAGTTPAPSGETGAASGRRFAYQLADRFPKGIVLIVVAGMSYAAAVADKGFNVLDSAELLAQRLVPDMLKKLAKR
jgi:hypothetical protein